MEGRYIIAPYSAIGTKTHKASWCATLFQCSITAHANHTYAYRPYQPADQCARGVSWHCPALP